MFLSFYNLLSFKLYGGNVEISHGKIIIIIIIILDLFIESSLISAYALFCVRALFGGTRIHSYTRMASLNRTRLSDLCRHFRRGNLRVQLYPRMKTFLLVPRRASNHQRTTSWGVYID